MADDTLFPDLVPQPKADHAEKVSADRARTLRQRTDLAHGIHPLTHLPLHPAAPRVTVPWALGDGPRCGSCLHLKPGTYLKCDLVPRTNGPGTDARRWWPGCQRWEPANPGTPPGQPKETE